MIPDVEPSRLHSQPAFEDSEGEIVIEDVDYSLSSDESRSHSPLINTMVQMEEQPDVRHVNVVIAHILIVASS